MGKDAPKSNLGSTNPHDHVGLLYRLANEASLSKPFLNIEIESYVSEMYPYLVRCCRSFDPSLGFQVSTLIGASIKKAMPEIIAQIQYGSMSSHRNKGRKSFNDSIKSLGAWDPADKQSNYEDKIVEIHSLNHMLSKLDPRTAEVFVRYVGKGETLVEIAKDFDVGNSMILKLKNEAIRDLRKMAEGETNK